MPSILGVKVDSLTRAQAIVQVGEMLTDVGQHIVTTPNPEFIVATQCDTEFREILNRASLALPDGMGLMFAARVLGMPLKERIAGSDFVWDIARIAAQSGHTIYLLGAGQGIAQAAAEKLKLQFPNLKIVGAESGSQFSHGGVQDPALQHCHPEPSEGSHTDVCNKIRDARPDILLVALGHGKQEKWIAAHLSELPSVKIAMGVGGVFDFLAGRVRRAPHIMRILGLEWLWRLLREPRRLPRIFRATIVFPLLVLRHIVLLSSRKT